MAFNFPSSPVIDQVYGEYYWDGEKWSVTAVATLDSLLLETGSGLPYLVETVGLTPAAVNMLPWTKDATYTDFSWADASVNGHPGGFTKAGLTVGTLVAAPDGTTTGRRLAEDSSTGNHQVWTFFGPQMQTKSNVNFRAAAIVKAGTRTRVVLMMGANSYETIVGASVGFDLAGGNVGYDVVVGSSTVVTATAMTTLGNGWWLCTFDFRYTGTYGSVAFQFNFNPRLYIDNGSGTAARSISYAGGGSTAGVYAWWLNMLPTAAWNLTSEAFRDDFESLSTIDLTNSLAPGFNWYVNNNAPNSLNTTWWLTLPVTPAANLTLSSPSVLQIYNPNASAPQWNSMIYSVGFPLAGGFVGQDWQAPMLMEGMFQWDSTLPYASYGFLGPALWSHTREIMDNTQNPSKYWMEWDITDIGATTAAVFDHHLDAVNAPVGGGASWTPSVTMSPSNWYRISGLWLNMAATNSGQGLFLHFFDGSFTQFSDVVYNACDAPQPPYSLALGWNSQAEWQHMPIMMDTGNNTSATPGGGWPMRVDWVRVVLHPSPPKIYNFWNIFDQFGPIVVGNNGRQLTKTTAGSSWEAIRASFTKTSGKWYWEVTITGTVASSTALMLGVMSHAASMASGSYPGSSAAGAGICHGYTWSGLINGVTGTYTGSPVVFASGDVFGFAFNAGTGTMYIHRNGTWINGDPATGPGVWAGLTSPTKWYPAASIHDASAVTISTNFGSAAFVYVVPSGYLGMSAN